MPFADRPETKLDDYLDDDLEAPTLSSTSSTATRVQTPRSATLSATVRPSSPDDDSAQPSTRNAPPDPHSVVGRRASEKWRRSSLFEQLEDVQLPFDNGKHKGNGTGRNGSCNQSTVNLR